MADALLTTGDAITKRQRYESLRSALRLDRASFDAHWRELADFLVPRRIRFTTTDRNRGDRRNQHIVDNIGCLSVRTLQSGLHAGLTSPARPWMKLSTPDPALAKFGPVKAWLYDVTQRMLAVFEMSNLYNVLPVLYGDLGVFGTGAMGVLEDDHDLFRCYSYPIGSYALGLDRRGLATSFVRDTILTVEQLIDEYGRPNGGTEIDWTVFSDTVKNLWQRGQKQSPIEVTQVIAPNPNMDPDKFGAAGMRWTSCHYERGSTDGRFLRESGFRRFPILVPRWSVTGEDTYGTDCPGMTALGDVKGLQTLQKRKAQAIEKMVNPPMIAPNSLRTQAVSMVPGGITYDDSREGKQGLRPAYEMNFQVAAILEDIREHEHRVQRAFYEDLFLMLAQSDDSRGAQPITAREVDERHEEKLLALGPVVERTNDELLDPLVHRVFDLMTRVPAFIPPMPPDLHGVQLRIEYTSLMAEAQKLVGVAGQDRFFGTLTPLVQLWPAIVHKINPNKVVDKYADELGIDPALIVSDEDAAASLQAAMKAAQQQQAAEQFKNAAIGTKALGTTPLDTGDTALSKLVSGVTSAG